MAEPEAGWVLYSDFGIHDCCIGVEMRCLDMRRFALLAPVLLCVALACGLSAETRFVHAEGKFLAGAVSGRQMLARCGHSRVWHIHRE